VYVFKNEKVSHLYFYRCFLIHLQTRKEKMFKPCSYESVSGLSRPELDLTKKNPEPNAQNKTCPLNKRSLHGTSALTQYLLMAKNASHFVSF
jgi:hypothetical protein